MPDPHRAGEREPEQARLVRRLHRQVAMGTVLALLIILNRYVPLGTYESPVQWLQVLIASGIAIDVLVRPLLRYVLPDVVILDYGKRKK